jgi:hypothetical protein
MSEGQRARMVMSVVKSSDMGRFLLVEFSAARELRPCGLLDFARQRP